MPEMERLRQQYKRFNQNIENQKIVDEDNINYVVHNCRSCFQRHRQHILIGYPLAIVLFAGAVLLFGRHVAFAVLAALILLLGMCAELWITKDLAFNSNKAGLSEWAQQHFTAKRVFLVYYLTLICSLYFIVFMVSATADVPNCMASMVNIVIGSLFGVSLVGFLLLYLPIYRQCDEVARSVQIEIDKPGNSNKSFRFIGLVVLFFMAVTAVMKLLHLPGGTLAMIFAGLLVVVYACAGAVRLRRRRHCPIILCILLMAVTPLITYLAMARINCWPLGGPDRHWMIYRSNDEDDGASNGNFALVEVCTNHSSELAAEMQSALLKSGIAGILMSDSPALITVSASDTAQARTVLADNGGCTLDADLSIRWSLPDADGRCMLFLVHSNPLVGSQQGETRVLDHVFMLSKSYMAPSWLEMVLRPEAEARWQTAVFQFRQQQTTTTVAAVLRGQVICHGIIDHDDIGYKSLRFSLPSNAVISAPVLDELIRN